MAVLSTGGTKISATILNDLPNGKDDTSSIQVRRLTPSEIQLLRPDKRDSIKNGDGYGLIVAHQDFFK